MSIWLRFALVAFLLVIAGIEIMLFMVDEEVEDNIIHINGEKLSSIATLLAESIDAETYKEINDSSNYRTYDTTAFNKVREQLIHLKNRLGFEEEIYTLERISHNKAIFGVMTNYSTFYGDTLYLKSIPARMALNIVWVTKEPYHTLMYEDQYGHWISGLAPVLDSEGNLVCILQADHESSFVYQLIDKIDRNSLWLRIFLFPVIIIITLVAVRFLSRPIKKVTDVIEEIAEGNYDKKLEATSSGEIKKLIESTRKMQMKIIGQRRQIEKHVENLEETVRKRTAEVVRQKDEIEEQNTELEAQNIELEAQNEEILNQQEILDRQSKEIAEANKELKKQNATKDKFFSIIAHDLKNPFNTLFNITKSLRDYSRSCDEDKMKDYSEQIYDASKITYSLLENLLTWSRSQLGTIRIKKEPVNIEEIIDNNIKLQKQTAEAKGVELSKEINSGTWVVADENTINTVIRNLISNAVKFTGNGGRVDILTEPDNGSVKVSVKDTGIGMTSEVLNKIFKIDEHHTTPGTNNEAGTGLGLILCKEFVEINAGTIYVSSEPGEGSTFTFTLQADDKADKKPVEKRRADDTYRKKTSNNNTKQQEPVLNFPPEETLIDLYEYARKGDIRAITDIIKKISAEKPALARFCLLMNSYLKQFDIQSIINFVEPHIRGEK